MPGGQSRSSIFSSDTSTSLPNAPPSPDLHTPPPDHLPSPPPPPSDTHTKPPLPKVTTGKPPSADAGGSGAGVGSSGGGGSGSGKQSGFGGFSMFRMGTFDPFSGSKGTKEKEKEREKEAAAKDKQQVEGADKEGFKKRRSSFTLDLSSHKGKDKEDKGKADVSGAGGASIIMRKPSFGGQRKDSTTGGGNASNASAAIGGNTTVSSNQSGHAEPHTPTRAGSLKKGHSPRPGSEGGHNNLFAELRDELGVSAEVKWSSPVSRKKDGRLAGALGFTKGTAAASSSSSSVSSTSSTKHTTRSGAKDKGPHTDTHTQSGRTGSTSGGSVATPSVASTGVLARSESVQLQEELEDGGDDEEEEGFVHGEILSYHLAFGAGPIGVVVSDTRAQKGVYIEDFIKIQTKHGPVPTAAEQSGRILIGDVITHVGRIDVQFSAAAVVRDLLEKCTRPVTISFERYLQRFTFQEVAQDPRKIPFYFEYLLTELEDSRHEQAKVMLLIETEQFRKQYRNTAAAARVKEAFRIYEKFFTPRSQFDVTRDVPPEIVQTLQHACWPPGFDLWPTPGAGGAGEALSGGQIPDATTNNNNGVSQNGGGGGRTLTRTASIELSDDDSRLSADMFDAAQRVLLADITQHSFAGFRRSKPHLKMIGYLSRSPEFVPLEPLEVLGDPEKLQYFMLYLMSARKHAALRCYLDIALYIQPKVTELEALIKQGLAETDMARKAVMALMQAALRIYSLYLCNGSYMEVPLKPLSALTHWLRGVLAARADIAKIQRRASKLAQTHAIESEIVGSQLLKEAHSRQAQSVFGVSVAESLAVGHELLEAQRSLLRDLACDVFPRFQAHPLYEALCEEVGPNWRTLRARQQSLILKPGAIKRLLRKVKLPREFALHRTGLPASTRAAGGPSPRGPDATASEMVDMCADWVVVFDTEFSPNAGGVRVRTTSQIPVSEFATSAGASGRVLLPAGIENFVVPEEFPTKVGTVAPDPLLFNFLIPGRQEQPFYGCCLIMYRPAHEAMEEDEGPEEQEEVVPASPMLHVDLTLSQTLTTLVAPQLTPTQPMVDAPVLMTPDSSFSQRRPSEGSSTGTRSRTASSVAALSDVDPLLGGTSRVKKLYKKERDDDDEEKIKALKSTIFASPRHDDGVKLAEEPDGGVDADTPTPRPTVDTPKFFPDDEEGETATHVCAHTHAHVEGGGDTQACVVCGQSQQKKAGIGLLSPGKQSSQEYAQDSQALQPVKEEETEDDDASGSPPHTETHTHTQAYTHTQAHTASGAASWNKLGRVEQGDEAMHTDEQSVQAEEDQDLIALVEDSLVQSLESIADHSHYAGAAGPPSPSPPSVSDLQSPASTHTTSTHTHTPTSISPLVSPAHLCAGSVSSPHTHNPTHTLSPVSAVTLSPALLHTPAAEKASSSAHMHTQMGVSQHTQLGVPQSTHTSVLQQPLGFKGLSPSARKDDFGKLKRGSTSFSVAGATAKALPLTLTYAPYGFCLISRYPFIKALRTPLVALFEQKKSISRGASALQTIQNAVAAQSPLRAPLAATDRAEVLSLTAPLNVQVDFDIDVLLRCLSPRNIVTVFLALLLECKVVLISERLTLLTVCAESLRFLIHPLKWCHLYVPMLPEVMVDHLVGCPTPYIMGLHRRTFLANKDDLGNEAVKVDLDNDLVEVPPKDLNTFVVPFAAPLARRFEKFANPTTALSDSFRWPTKVPLGEIDTRAALGVLRDFVYSLLVGMEDCCYAICTESEMTLLFDEVLFGHICGPAELLVSSPSDPDGDMLPHTPAIPPPPTDSEGPGGASSSESFVLRFSRTQAFSQLLMRRMQQQDEGSVQP